MLLRLNKREIGEILGKLQLLKISYAAFYCQRRKRLNDTINYSNIVYYSSWFFETIFTKEGFRNWKNWINWRGRKA